MVQIDHMNTIVAVEIRWKMPYEKINTAISIRGRRAIENWRCRALHLRRGDNSLLRGSGCFGTRHVAGGGRPC